MIASLVLGIITLVLGVALRYWINRRRFYRRAPTGAQGFSSYEKSVAITFVERIGKWIAWALIILGVLFIGSYWWQKKKKESARPLTEVISNSQLSPEIIRTSA